MFCSRIQIYEKIFEKPSEDLIYTLVEHLNSFDEFITEGLSKNHPIQELREKEKLGIVLLGAPGSGKSTFANQVILPNNRNTKVFSTDEISKLFTKDPNVYHVGSAELNIQYLKNFIKTGQNFIYDTTGGNERAVFEVCKKANNAGYKIIFVLILVDLPTAKDQNILRGKLGGHQVDEDYIDYVYSTQNQTTKNFIKLLKHESFYIVLNKSGKYRYFKHIGDRLLKRKIDKYVPMSESHDEELKDLLKNLNHKMKGFIRVGTPDEIYEDYFLELKESENFRVRIDKGNGFVTNIEIEGMIDSDKVESEFNRILNKMKMIKERLHNQFNFDCHFMIRLNGQSQQDLNDKTHRNDDYKFKGVGTNKRGYDKDFYYTDGEIGQWDRNYKPFPDDKVAVSIRFMIV